MKVESRGMRVSSVTLLDPEGPRGKRDSEKERERRKEEEKQKEGISRCSEATSPSVSPSMPHSVHLLLLLSAGGCLSSPVTPTLTSVLATPSPDPCEGQPCLNSGSCVPQPVLPLTPESQPDSQAYTCSCSSGFTGRNCEDKKGDRRYCGNGAAGRQWPGRSVDCVWILSNGPCRAVPESDKRAEAGPLSLFSLEGGWDKVAEPATHWSSCDSERNGRKTPRTAIGGENKDVLQCVRAVVVKGLTHGGSVRSPETILSWIEIDPDKTSAESVPLNHCCPWVLLVVEETVTGGWKVGSTLSGQRDLPRSYVSRHDPDAGIKPGPYQRVSTDISDGFGIVSGGDGCWGWRLGTLAISSPPPPAAPTRNPW
ncbi:hypothetical protein JZ751_001950 [Albula glossodonta]|uniref:EGF-like domain-containing protein n=1 Tax=Albula glossodonta TaxID=121402 RepID=A0A8T2P6N1_9TELE|nr:hypothetical protein JZ751_001950 [Albula glossodonta]